MTRKASHPSALLDLNALSKPLTQQLEAGCRAQAAVLKAWQAAADQWFEHRRAGIEAARDAMSHMLDCHDLNELTQLQQKWMMEAVDRLSSEVRSCADGVLTVATEVAEEPLFGAAGTSRPNSGTRASAGGANS